MADVSLFVRNFPYTVSDGKLRSFFEAQVPVESARVVKDRKTGRSRGFGFVVVDEKDVQKVMDVLNGKEFEGRPLLIEVSEKQEQREKKQSVQVSMSAKRKDKGASVTIKITDAKKKPLEREVRILHDGYPLYTSAGSDVWKSDNRGEIGFDLGHADKDNIITVEDVETNIPYDRKLDIVPARSKEELEAIREGHIADTEAAKTRAWEAQQKREKSESEEKKKREELDNEHKQVEIDILKKKLNEKPAEKSDEEKRTLKLQNDRLEQEVDKLRKENEPKNVSKKLAEPKIDLTGSYGFYRLEVYAPYEDGSTEEMPVSVHLDCPGKEPEIKQYKTDKNGILNEPIEFDYGECDVVVHIRQYTKVFHDKMGPLPEPTRGWEKAAYIVGVLVLISCLILGFYYYPQFGI